VLDVMLLYRANNYISSGRYKYVIYITYGAWAQKSIPLLARNLSSK
jgi:hypothetical protein